MTFIPYQIDYAVTNAAKTLGFSKKKVSFKFGFANLAAPSGSTGAACRGSEHEVVFIWSLASGKRQLLLDGKDVHYSESGQNGWTSDRAWQHSFPLHDAALRQTLKVHFISQPVSKDIPDSRPFDLRVGGISYFSFNQIFQLGTTAMTTRGGSHQHHDPDRDMMTAEERRLVAQAKLESLKEYEQNRKSSNHRPQQQQPVMKHEEDLLISFDDPAPRTVAPAVVGNGYVNAQQPFPGFMSSLSLGSDFEDSNAPSPSMMQQQAPQPPNAPSYGVPTNQYSFAGPPPANPYAPTYQQPPLAPYTSNAMALYQPPAAAPAPNPYASYPTGAPPPNPYTNNYNQPPSPSMQSFASFGSAPSFAQPPKPPGQDAFAPGYGFSAPPPPPQQQQQQQQQQPYSYY
ncbi:hypothetical protein FisN_14Lh282 [Fistulifera solaris]|uniref:Uncharacterized protein n=1 Tax=Fistulifera solaris TaxID=1519565 RepID=A0A1Z5JA38_FISSO|nr:hypothetical protein FisN_14Lh282 [Fistulifera solaris]|eukprot:GAX10762.1 hypothetical protein FisN_14Lh282 [Fistulifera solaris]